MRDVCCTEGNVYLTFLFFDKRTHLGTGLAPTEYHKFKGMLFNML